MPGSNRRSSPCKGDDLTTNLISPFISSNFGFRKMILQSKDQKKKM